MISNFFIMEKYSLQLIILIALVFNCASQENGLLKAIKEEVAKLSASYPENYLNTIKNIQGYATMVTDSVDLKDLKRLNIKYNMPEDVYKRIRSLTFIRSANVQTFNVIITKNNAKMEQYIGAGVKDKNIIKFAYFKIVSFGTIIPKYLKIRYQICKTYLFVIKNCQMKTRMVQRGNSLEEINIMKTSLRAYAYNALNTKISSINNTTQLILTEGGEISSMSNSKKAIIIPSTGQIFVGGKGFTGEILDHAENYGQLLGEKQNKEFGPFNLQLSDNGTLSVISGKGDIVYYLSKEVKGLPPYRLSVTDDGYLYLSDTNWMPLMNSDKKLKNKEIILLQDYRFYSENGKYYVQIQRDGDIILYKEKPGEKNDKIIWNTETLSKYQGPFSLVVEKNGNMAIIDGKKESIWATGKTTKVPGPHKLHVSNNGVLQVLNGRKGVIWSSNQN